MLNVGCAGVSNGDAFWATLASRSSADVDSGGGPRDASAAEHARTNVPGGTALRRRGNAVARHFRPGACGAVVRRGRLIFERSAVIGGDRRRLSHALR